MTPLEVIDISRDALWVLLKIGAPVMLTALLVGLIIALFQALTQIQEMTLDETNAKAVPTSCVCRLAVSRQYDRLQKDNKVKPVGANTCFICHVR